MAEARLLPPHLAHDLLELLVDGAPVELRVPLVERVAQPLLLEQQVADRRAAVLVHVPVDQDGAPLGPLPLVRRQRCRRVFATSYRVSRERHRDARPLPRDRAAHLYAAL